MYLLSLIVLMSFVFSLYLFITINTLPKFKGYVKTGNKKPLPIFLLTGVMSGRQSFQFLYINVAITNKIIVNQNVKAKVICIITTPFCLSFLIMQIAYDFNISMSSCSAVSFFGLSSDNSE